ncbi:hypothetical protein GCM10009530_60850 [Microbispora corallina]|uniref:Uncharacterized protein n=1 Tax=Microbispora corallina TaxID=83302 RepID=A0ABQ4FZ59_9ACTN|nr:MULTISPECIES: hypothetical protein [Microbispora]ETK37283.1 hypothetical protein MPTA5024_04935 [Microbispora sp. ATCC PTA-5024]GIH40071.1 hypothetical protein Mco01_30710 [Microbispora corallina]
MPTPEIGNEGLLGTSERARRALDALRRQGPEAVQEETLRMKAEFVRLYGWEGYQRVMAKMESDLARLRQSR